MAIISSHKPSRIYFTWSMAFFPALKPGSRSGGPDNDAWSMSEEIEWPTTEGIWMGWFEDVGWFPMKTMFLRDDCPTLAMLRIEQEEPLAAPPRRPLALVAQFPESAASWPFTFQKCHPAKKWRRPDEDELFKALAFYGLHSEAQLSTERMRP